MIRHIALISPLDCFDNYGLRTLSSYLRSKGIRTRMIFLPSYSQIWKIVTHQKKPDLYSRQLLNDIKKYVEPCDAIGITMMSSDRDRVASLTGWLNSLKKPLIIGGVHPTSCPEDALELADYVCAGEGYEALYEWCLDPENHTIRNLWVRSGGTIVRNNIRPAIRNIDSLPFPDYGPDDHFVRDRDRLVPVTETILRKYMGTYYSVFTSHGCPFGCTFCINSRYRHLGNGYGRFRHHSVRYVIDHLKHCLKLSPDLEYVSIADDGFIYHGESYIEAFCDMYRKEINLPFAVMGIIPEYLTRKKLDLLVNAGMIRTRTGIQSGNRDTLKSYRRPGNISRFESCHDLLRSYPGLVFPYYDVIIDNPLVDTEQDMLDTIHMFLRFKGRFTLILYSMRLYQGTDIHDNAQQKQVSDHYYNSHYGNYPNSLLTFTLMVIQCTGFKWPVKMLLKLHTRFGNIRVPGFLIRSSVYVWLFRQGAEHFRKGDVSTLPRWISRWFMRSRRYQYPKTNETRRMTDNETILPVLYDEG